MPLAFLIIAILAGTVAIKGNWQQVGAQAQSDSGFIQFIIGIIAIAVFFRLIEMPNAGRIFIILVIGAYLLQNSNVLTQLQNLSTGK